MRQVKVANSGERIPEGFVPNRGSTLTIDHVMHPETGAMNAAGPVTQRVGIERPACGIDRFGEAWNVGWQHLRDVTFVRDGEEVS